ncbi:MAG: cysteine hydrolase family protein [Candidatus Methanofastidiosia archaeon]
MKALLVIDMLNDFVSEKGSLYVPGAEELILYINEKIREFREKKEPMIFVCDSHAENDVEFEIWPPHCIKGTWGSEIHPELEVHPEDLILEKTTYSAFFKTELEEILQEKKIENLLLCGVCTDICVLHTAADAKMRDYEVKVLKKGVKTLSQERQRFGLSHMADVLNVEIL